MEKQKPKAAQARRVSSHVYGPEPSPFAINVNVGGITLDIVVQAPVSPEMRALIRKVENFMATIQEKIDALTAAVTQAEADEAREDVDTAADKARLEARITELEAMPRITDVQVEELTALTARVAAINAAAVPPPEPTV